MWTFCVQRAVPYLLSANSLLIQVFFATHVMLWSLGFGANVLLICCRYCTGGVRCELASAYLRSKGKGFEDVLQVEPVFAGLD